MVDLQQAARDLVEHPVRLPTPLATLEQRAGRLRRRRRAMLAGITSAVVAVLVVALIDVATSQSDRNQRVVAGPGTEASTGIPASTSPAPPAIEATTTTSPLPKPAVPDGWKPVDYSDARIYVPPDWNVLRSGTGVSCQTADRSVLVGTADVIDLCKQSMSDGSASPSFVRLQSTTPSTTGSPSRQINGLEVASAGRDNVFNRYYIPGLGVSVTTTGAGSDSILETITTSSRHQVLQSGPIPTTPPDWQKVTYGGVSLSVPSSWPTERLNTPNRIPPGCGGPQIFFEPLIYLGNTANFKPSCPPQIDGPNPMDGIWIYAGGFSAGTNWSTHRIDISGREATVYAADEQLVVEVVITPLQGEQSLPHVVIGLGPDPSVARTILYSIRVA